MKIKILNKIGLVFVISFLLTMPTAPVFAQLGGVAPPPAVTDLCLNIDGAQGSIPTGMILDGSGNCITPVPADTTAPVISGVAHLSLGVHDGTIVWITDELAVSHLEYGATINYGTQATLDATALLAHTAVLLGLTPNTTYYYCIHATDLANNTANSCGHSFTTAAQPVVADTTPPDVTLITEAPITTTSATISWTTSEVGNARLEYGTTAGYGTTTPLDTNLALTHSVTLSNLTPNTEYHYRIISSDEAGNATTTSDETFMTEAISGGVVVQNPADTTPSVVSGVGSVTLGITDATLAWTTSELTVSTLEYGMTQNYGSQATLSLTAGLAHTATLTGLTGGVTYYYCIHATDLAGNLTNSCPHSFTTEPVAVIAPVTSGTDTTAPQISLITTAPITMTDAMITWTTNELATSQIQYGATTNYGQTTSLGTTPSLTHLITLSSLFPDTTYHYRLTSTDASNNTGLSSDETFTTSALSQASTVIISGMETTSIATSTVTIVWNTDLPSDSQVEYGNSDNFGSFTTLNSTLTTSHTVTIIGLAQNTNYIFRVKSKPLGVAVATVSNNDEFNTLNHSTPVVAGPNILSVSSPGVTSSGATISWTTDKTATSQVEYGISTSYGQTNSLDTSIVTSHSISLANLEAGTVYHFRVKSTDEVSNVTFSEDYTFTTATTSTPSVPAAITTLTVGAYDNSSVELVWNVVTEFVDLTAAYDIRVSTIAPYQVGFDGGSPAQITPIYYGDLDPSGTRRAYIVAGLNPSTIYYFTVLSKHEQSDYSALSNTVSVTTTSGAIINNESVSVGGDALSATSAEYVSSVGGGSGGIDGGVTGSYEPTLIKAEPADKQVILEWNNPGEKDFVRTVVVRREDGYPASPSNGQVIYEGREKTFTDTNVQNGTTYYYALYSYNHHKTYSNPIRFSLAPNAGNKEIKFNESGSLVSSTPALHFVRNFKKGDKDIEIEHLQEILSIDQDTYPEKYVTGYFGSLTQSALQRFQKKHGLPQTGFVDQLTQKELNTISQSETKLDIPTNYVVFDSDLKYGDQGDAVKDLQQYLIYEGSYVEALISGNFGNYTKNAVMKFQKKYNITPVSGFVGYKTRHKMQQLSGL